jgi:hypothetical protein
MDLIRAIPGTLLANLASKAAERGFDRIATSR